jgi:hypothetical protein
MQARADLVESLQHVVGWGHKVTELVLSHLATDKSFPWSHDSLILEGLKVDAMVDTFRGAKGLFILSTSMTAKGAEQQFPQSISSGRSPLGHVGFLQLNVPTPAWTA